MSQIIISSAEGSPKSKRSRLVSDLMSDKTIESSTSCSGGRFFVRGSNDDFQSRQSNVFDKLNALEDKHSSDIATWQDSCAGTSSDVTEECDSDEEDECTSRFCEQAPVVPPTESVIRVMPSFLADNQTIKPDDMGTIEDEGPTGSPFKVPVGLPPKRNPATAVPDYRIHPDKWTKYTLADVTDDSISDATNSKVAFEFLSSRWKTGADYSDETDAVTSSEDDEPPPVRHVWTKVQSTVSQQQHPEKPCHGASSGGLGNVKSKLVHLVVPDCPDSTAPDEDQAHDEVVIKHDQESTTFTGDDQPVQTFRPVRKRKRNLRKNISDTDETLD